MKYIFPVVVSSLGSLAMYMHDKKINPFKFKIGPKIVKSKNTGLIKRVSSNFIKRISDKWKFRFRLFGFIFGEIINYKIYIKRIILREKIKNLPWTSVETEIQHYDKIHGLDLQEGKGVGCYVSKE